MNLFNRVVIVILLVVFLAATFLSLLSPPAVVDILRNALDQIEVTIPFYNILSGAYWAYLGVGLGIIVLCGLLLWLELRPPRRKTVEVSDAEGYRVQVSVKSITQRLQTALGGVADVSRVKPKVISRGKKVDVTLDVQVHPAVDLPLKTDEITQVTREVIQERMGISVGKVRVKMQDGPDGPRAVPEPELPLPTELPEPDQPVLPVELEPTAQIEPEYMIQEPVGEDSLEPLDASAEA